MYIIKDGEMFIKEDGIEYHLVSGDILLLEPNLMHVGYRQAVCDYYYIHFKHDGIQVSEREDEEDLQELMEKRRKCLIGNNLEESKVIDSITYLPKFMNIPFNHLSQELKTATSIYNHREEFYKLHTSTLVHSFLLNISHQMLLNYLAAHSTVTSKKSIHICEGIIHYLNHHYMEKITSEDIEDIFEVNFDYINRVFSSVTKTTIFRYINQLRINNAMQLIETSNLSFSEIAYLVGIEDQYYFSRKFRQFTNMTPTQYYNLTHERKD